MTLVLGVLAASVLGSVHCAAMCGPIVCTWALHRGGVVPARAHLAYHGGRLLSYVLLGALAGSLGAGVQRAGALAGVGRAAALLAATLLLVWGIASLARLRGVRFGFGGVGSPWGAKGLGAVLMRLRDAPLPVRSGATGVLTTLIPCGWLYAFVTVAGGTGSTTAGALVMLVFWGGTLPALTAVALGARRISPALASRLPVASAVLVVALALLALFGRVQPLHQDAVRADGGKAVRHAGH